MCGRRGLPVRALEQHPALLRRQHVESHNSLCKMYFWFFSVASVFISFHRRSFLLIRSHRRSCPVRRACPDLVGLPNCRLPNCTANGDRLPTTGDGRLTTGHRRAAAVFDDFLSGRHRRQVWGFRICLVLPPPPRLRRTGRDSLRGAVGVDTPFGVPKASDFPPRRGRAGCGPSLNGLTEGGCQPRPGTGTCALLRSQSPRSGRGRLLRASAT
jgi:hypothetical protein